MDHITCSECRHFVEGNKCALTMELKPLGSVRGDQWCEQAEAICVGDDVVGVVEPIVQ